MPNGRRWTERAGTVTIQSGHAAFIDPLALADLLGVERDAIKDALHKLATAGNAFQWTTMNGTYSIGRSEHGDGNVSYVVHH